VPRLLELAEMLGDAGQPVEDTKDNAQPLATAVISADTCCEDDSNETISSLGVSHGSDEGADNHAVSCCVTMSTKHQHYNDPVPGAEADDEKDANVACDRKSAFAAFVTMARSYQS
jgi:hypothetical protein